MKLSLQKKIVYIPIVNFIVIMFSWLKMYYRNDLSKVRFIKKTLNIFLYCFLFTVIRIILDKAIDSALLEDLIFYVSIMIYLFIISFVALKDQVKFASEKLKEVN